jgi:hypothetical protein
MEKTWREEHVPRIHHGGAKMAGAFQTMKKDEKDQMKAGRFRLFITGGLRVCRY